MIEIKPFKKMARSGTYDSRFERRYKIQYRAITDDPRIGPYAILDAFVTSFYTPGDSYVFDGGPPEPNLVESDTGSYLQTITADPENTEDGLNWVISCDYGPEEPVEESPLDRPAQVTWDFQAIERIVDIDIDGKAVVNTAYDPFDPPITREKKNPIVTVDRDEPQFPYDLAANLQDGINKFDFLMSGDAFHWKLNKISARSDQKANTLFAGVEVTFWPVRYELQYNDEGWKRTILNQGMRQLNAAGTAHEAIFVQGQPISSPMLLNNAGRVLAPAGVPVYRTYKVFKEIDFAVLNFSGIDFGLGPIL